MDGEDEPTGMYSRRLRTQHYITTEKRAARRSEFLECAKLPLFKDENMCFRNTQNSYGAVSKTFHWVIAVLVIIMLCAGVSFHYLTRGSSVFNVIMFIHKNKSLAEFMFHSHNYLAWTIAVLIVIHTLASLKHYFIDKDNVMQRMF